MAKQTVTVTQNWTQIATGECIITITKAGTEPLQFNDQSGDSNLVEWLKPVGKQFEQTETVPTYVRSESEWTLVVDGVL
jgi:hypothetical protein